MRAISLKVHGHVQGVGFRYFTATQAARYDIKGWVRNTVDGESVEIEALGEEQNIKRFVNSVSEGPPFSRVDDVSIKELDTFPTHSKFNIL